MTILPVLRRILVFVVSLWVIVTVGFVCVYLLPGDPARIILGPQASEDSVLKFSHDAGLDLSFESQYTRYLERIARFDFGESIAQRTPVLTLLRERTIRSLSLIGWATLITLFGGVVLPLVLKACGSEKLLQYSSLISQFIAFAPPYALAIFAVILFAGWAQVVPVLFDRNNLGSWLLAAGVLAIYPTTLLQRVLLSRLDEELRAPYARRAAALGFSPYERVFREVLPNVIPAAVSVFTNNISFFLTGAFFVEVVVGFPGLGRLAQQALSTKDIPVLVGVFLVFAVLILLFSLVLEILLTMLAPQRGRA